MAKGKKSKKYRNLGQLLEAHGVDTPYSFGRALYKWTDCGPWTVFVLSEAPAHDEVEDVVIACDPATNGARVESGNPSKDTLLVLGLDDPAGEAAKWPWRKYCEKLDEFVAEHTTVKRGYRPDEKLTITKKSVARRWIRVERHVPASTKDFYYENREEFDQAKCVGLRIGSIVEGSEVEVSPVTLEFPFSEEELDQAVKGIDEEASFYWERDNSKWYCLKSPDGEQFSFRETWGEVKWDVVPPDDVRAAAEKWSLDGGRWQKEDPKSPGMSFATCDEGEWIPLPGKPGWTVSEYVNDCTF